MIALLPSSLRPSLLPALLLAFLAGCAHTGSQQPSAGLPAQRQVLEDKDFGFTLELPAGRGFTPSNGQDDVVAQAQDGTSVRLFPEFFAQKPSTDACWERLLTRLPMQITNRPSSAKELAERGPKGLERQGRKLYVAPYPRGASCLVLVVEGPSDSRLLAEAAPLAIASFRPLEPSREMQARLAYEAGAQLSEMNEHAAALDRFEEALAIEPSLVRAHLGAGLSAFFAGPKYMPKAVEHLQKALSARAGEDGEQGPVLTGAQLRDALMYLGLAYSEMKDYPKASAQMAELVSRYPDDAVALYNFACVLALAGDLDESLAQLKEALAHDPELAEHAREDEDLVALHARPEWPQVVGAAPTPPSAR